MVTNIRFSHFIINGSTIYTSWIIPYLQHAAPDPRVNEKWARVSYSVLRKRGIISVLGCSEK